jgi:hypothetical protein
MHQGQKDGTKHRKSQVIGCGVGAHAIAEQPFFFFFVGAWRPKHRGGGVLVVGAKLGKREAGSGQKVDGEKLEVGDDGSTKMGLAQKTKANKADQPITLSDD